MKFLITPDKFKGSLTALQVCDAVEKGILNSLPNSSITKIPLADGGEGSLQVLEKTIQFERVYLKVDNPISEPVEACYGLKNNRAYIEMALASGLQLLNESKRNPMVTSSFGTGELIKDAVEKGAEDIYLFIGGSATNDAGIGIASALGYQFKDAENNILKPIGANLKNISSFESSSSIDLDKTKITVLTDVANPLFGENGAAYVFAKQKGADNSEIVELDKGLRNFAEVVENKTGKKVSDVFGAGAAGGVGAGMIAFCNAQIKSGIDCILDLLNIDGEIKQADLIITGEGLFDKQTLEGKVVKGVLDRCKKFKKPAAVICGDTTLSESEIKNGYQSFLKKIRTNNMSVDESMTNAYNYVIERTEELIKDFISS